MVSRARSSEHLARTGFRAVAEAGGAFRLTSPLFRRTCPPCNLCAMPPGRDPKPRCAPGRRKRRRGTTSAATTTSRESPLCARARARKRRAPRVDCTRPETAHGDCCGAVRGRDATACRGQRAERGAAAAAGAPRPRRPRGSRGVRTCGPARRGAAGAGRGGEPCRRGGARARSRGQRGHGAPLRAASPL